MTRTPHCRTIRGQSSGLLGTRWIFLLVASSLALIQWLPHVAAFQSGILPPRKFQCCQQNKDFTSPKKTVDLRFPFFAAKSDSQDLDDVNEKTPATKNSGNSRKKISYLANDANLSSWTENNPTWDQNIAALLEYNQTYGTVNLPEKSKEYPNLALWVKNLRQQKGRLAKDQIQQLNEIGFLWKDSRVEKHDKKWHEMFTKLQAYKEAFGHCNVPQTYEPDPKLGGWVKRQRREEIVGRLREDRYMMLESIGFRWSQDGGNRRSEIWEKAWENKYQELIEFKEEHNHANVPMDYPPNQELGYWVNCQRIANRDNTLYMDRRAKLDKIGFIWEFEPIWDESWLEQYEELKCYQQELASYQEMIQNSPGGSEAAMRPVLGDRLHPWAANQRLYHSNGDLDPQRKAMLDNIGFEWWE